MLPSAILPDYDIVEQPSKTWQIDLTGNRVLSNTIDGLDAVVQAAIMRLLTRKGVSIIFSHSYGSELASLIGAEKDYALSEAKRMITEALTEDSRITGSRDYSETGGIMTFVIDTVYGSKPITMEVLTGADL